MSKNKKKQQSQSPTISGLSDDVARFMSDLQKETDRGAALVAAAFIDDVLKSMLIAKFVDRPKEVKNVLGRPLFSFSSRIELAFLLGLVGPKTYKGLEQILTIRNRFAHSHKALSFDDKIVSKECEKLNLIDLSSLDPNLNPRWRFLNQSMFLANLLLVRGHSLDHFDVGKDFKLSKIISG